MLVQLIVLIRNDAWHNAGITHWELAHNNRKEIRVELSLEPTEAHILLKRQINEAKAGPATLPALSAAYATTIPASRRV